MVQKNMKYSIIPGEQYKDTEFLITSTESLKLLTHSNFQSDKHKGCWNKGISYYVHALDPCLQVST